jgi:hypothetical protein
MLLEEVVGDAENFTLGKGEFCRSKYLQTHNCHLPLLKMFRSQKRHDKPRIYKSAKAPLF